MNVQADINEKNDLSDFLFVQISCMNKTVFVVKLQQTIAS